MSTFHTPRCRIDWTVVHSNGVERNLVVFNQPMTLFMGAWLDPTLKAGPGIWVFNFRLLALNDQGGSQSADRSHIWSGLMQNVPWVGSFNANVTWQQAIHFTAGEMGWYLFQPRIYIRLPGFQNNQFAYPEAPHYILITDGT